MRGGFTLDRLKKTQLLVEVLDIYFCWIWFELVEHSPAKILCDKVKQLLLNLCRDGSENVNVQLSEQEARDVLVLTNPHVTVQQWRSRQCWHKKCSNQKSNQVVNLKNFDPLKKEELIMEEINELLTQFVSHTVVFRVIMCGHGGITQCDTNVCSKKPNCIFLPVRRHIHTS